MSKLLHLSSAPHDRGGLSTKSVMWDVLVALLPTVVLGIGAHGLYAAVVILVSVAAAVATEYLFDYVTKRENTLSDGSAMVTGLMLALTLPANVPLYIPAFGSVFAILIVKCLFGGLGHNIMNPALAGRSFLLISFSASMTSYTYDGVSSATPLAQVAAGESVDIAAMIFGSTSGVIGSSAIGLLAGGIYLLLSHGITWEIPTATIASTAVFLAIFGGHGVDPTYLIPQLLGGGLLMAAFFMATDPVTGPSTTKGQLLYGTLTGVLIGLFRVKGSADDSTTYAVLLANLFGNLIDELFIPIPYGYRIPKEFKKAIPKPVIILLVITIIAGLALSGVYVTTANRIAQNNALANQAAYQTVLPEAESFSSLSIEDASYDTVTVQAVLAGEDAEGNTVGYVISVHNSQAFSGDGLTLAVGILPDGTLTGIHFTQLSETAGMGMRCSEPEFMIQFENVNVPAFTLNKSGTSTQEDVIDSVSGATITSGAVVDAVNAALQYFAENLK
jgi:RnfABCDGE-type electron transport complex D subunit/RnfABCDGE-type electron transport complex G subunit